VNTIVNEQGRLKGYNTDGLGFMTALTKVAGDVKEKRVVVLGAGGAARAVVYSLVRAGAEVTVLNRTLAHAESLVQDLGGEARGIDKLPQFFAQADILVYTTSVGLHGVNESPIPKELLRKGLVVFDLVYDVRGTQLLKDAQAAGCIRIPGTEMLFEQAIHVFKLYTGHDAPVGVMREALEEKLGH
jgi:shikimate dehydrogenase